VSKLATEPIQKLYIPSRTSCCSVRLNSTFHHQLYTIFSFRRYTTAVLTPKRPIFRPVPSPVLPSKKHNVRQGSLLPSLAAIQLLSVAVACPFHNHDTEKTQLINHRRSPLGECGRTAIEDIRVFNGWKFTRPQTVCLDNGYIVSVDGCVGSKNTVKGTGKFLIPGLIDSHVHLTDVQSLEDFTSYVCTTAMHMNCRNYTQCDIMAKQPGLAAFIHAGRSAVGNGSMHEAQDPTRPKDTLIYPDTNMTQFTEWQLNNGSDFHKITAAEVNGPSTQQQIEMVQVAHC
jgi:hypothetical protein